MAAAPPGHKDLWLFLGLTYVLGWSLLLLIPLLGLEPASRAASILVVLYGFAPAFSTWLVERVAFFRPELAARTGLNARVDGIRMGGWFALGWFGTPLVLIAALVISGAMGGLHLDLETFPTLRAAMEASPELFGDRTPRDVFISNVVSALVLGPIVSVFYVFGAEWGFRGWLLPRLWVSHGPWKALLGHGLLMGLWMLPLALVGLRAPGAPLLGAGMLLVHTVLLGLVLGWMRLSTGSIWPGVVAQGSIFALTGVLTHLQVPDAPVDPLLAGFSGLPGLLLLALLSVLLLVLRRLPCPPPPAPLPGDGWASTSSSAPVGS